MFFNDWLDILLFKKKPADIAATTIGDGLKNLVIATVITGFLSGLLQYLSLPQILAASGIGAVPGAAELVQAVSVVSIVTSTIMTPILAVIGVIIAGAILHVLCMIVGGKGNIANYIGVLAKISAAIAGTATLILLVIGIIMAAANMYMAGVMVIGLISMVVALWEIVLVVLATKAVQQLSTGRAIIAVIVIPFVIGIILAVLLAAVFLALIMAAIGGAGGLGGMTGAFPLA